MKKLRSLIVSTIAATVILAAVSQAAAFSPAQSPQAESISSSPIESGADDNRSDDTEILHLEQPVTSTVATGPAEAAGAEPWPPMTVVAEAADGYIVFVEDAGSVIAGASAWPQVKLEALIPFYGAAFAAYTGEQGFGTVELWAAAFGITRDSPIRVVYAGNQPDPVPARAGWVEGTAIITHYKLRTSVSTKGIQLVIHELANIWDGAHSWALGEAVADTVQNPDGFPTAKARDEGPKEDFAESVTATLWPGYAVNQAWSDDEPGAEGDPDATWTLDRHDYIEALLQAGM